MGSASGMPVPQRASSSYLVEVGERGYLFDMGEGCSSSLLRMGVDQESIVAGFISHMHPDHSSGLPLLLQLMHLSGRKTPFEVWLPAEAREGVEVCLRTFYIFPERFSFPLRLHPIEGNPILPDSLLTVSVSANHHLADYRGVVGPQQNLESYSFEIEVEGKVVDYSGDMGSLSDLEDFVSNPDVLITECMHISVEELLGFLSQHRIGETILTHIPPQLEGKERYIKALAERLGVRGVRMAYDGLKVEL